MTKVAMIEYWTSPTQTIIFLLKKGMDKPLTYTAKMKISQEVVTQSYLTLCAQRLIVDFHGLPEHWNDEKHREHFKRVLTLPPAVNAMKRSQEVLTQNLKKPAFAYTLDYWEALSDILLPMELRAQIADCELLCIVPHGPLHALPFTALRWSEHEYLIERFGISYVHSASVLRYCQAKNRKRVPGLEHQPESCLIVAVATERDQKQYVETDGDILARLLLERNAHARIQKLIGKGKEAEEGGGEAVLPADKEHFQQLASHYDFIHMACHGVFGDNEDSDPLDSALLLSSGGRILPDLKNIRNLDPTQQASFLLTAREIFHFNLTADLVTLRACSSGRTYVGAGDELMGLTRAFLFAGTPSLIVSLWNVNIPSSQRLLNEFYRLWLNDRALPKWQALQQAQICMLRDPNFQHPYHWAPFILVGDWI